MIQSYLQQSLYSYRKEKIEWEEISRNFNTYTQPNRKKFPHYFYTYSCLDWANTTG